MSVYHVSKVFHWFKGFEEKRDIIADDPHFSRPCTLKTDANIENILKMLR